MPRIAVIDFETTGLSPAMGDRATEIAIVMLEGGAVAGRFQSLMNAGVPISPFIESFTGISNAMVRAAPPASGVMAAALLARIQADLCQRFELAEARHALLMKIQASPKHAMAGVVKKYVTAA